MMLVWEKHRMVVGQWKKEGNMPVALHGSYRREDNAHRLKDMTYNGSIISETLEGNSIFVD
jgi:hypothetical protein